MTDEFGVDAGSSQADERRLAEILDRLEREDEGGLISSWSAEYVQQRACPRLTAVTVSGFPRYRHSIPSLPAVERAKIARMAQMISASARPGCQFLGSV